MTKKELRQRIDDLNEADLKTLRAMINGKLSKRTISAEKQAEMQAARK